MKKMTISDPWQFQSSKHFIVCWALCDRIIFEEITWYESWMLRATLPNENSTHMWQFLTLYVHQPSTSCILKPVQFQLLSLFKEIASGEKIYLKVHRKQHHLFVLASFHITDSIQSFCQMCLSRNYKLYRV